MVVDTLTHVSLKATLQNILASLFHPELTLSPLTPDLGAAFPPDAPPSSMAVTYGSALALKLTGRTAQNAAGVATHLAQQYAQRHGMPCPLLAGFSAEAQAIAPHLSVSATAKGWLWVTVAAAGVAIWLQQMNQINTLGMLGEPSSPNALLRLPPSPLGDHLRLSPRAFLHYSHARCGAYLRQGSEAGWITLAQGEPDPWRIHGLAPDLANTFSHPLTALLFALLHRLDTAADQGGDPLTCLRQGLHLGEAVYRFQAAVPLHGAWAAPEERAIALWLMRGAQQGLGLLIQRGLGVMPIARL